MQNHIIKYASVILVKMLFLQFLTAQVYSDAIGVTGLLPKYDTNKTVVSDALDATLFIPNGYTSSMNGDKLSPPGFDFNSDAINWGVIDRDEMFNDTLSSFKYVEAPFALTSQNTQLINENLYDIYHLGLLVGTYIVKRDVNTGEKLWEYHTAMDNNDKIELDLSIFERDDGNIETTGFRLYATAPTPVPVGPVNRKVFNSQTGELLSQNYTWFEDGGHYCLNPNGQKGRIFPMEEDELYLSICAYNTTDGQYIGISRTGDGEGALLDTIDYVENLLTGFTPSFRYFDAKQLPNGNIAVAVSSFVNPTVQSTVKAEVLIFNHTGELLNRIDVNELLRYTVNMTIDIVEDKILLTSRSLVNNNTAYRTNLVVINESGNVYHQYNELEELNSGAITLLDDGRLLVAGNSFEDNCLNVFVGSDGNLDLVHSLCHEDEQWSVIPRQLLRYGDDVILKGKFAYDTTYVDMGEVIQEKIHAFETTLSLSLSQIGVTVSTNDIPSQKSSFTLFPNPSSQRITISGDEVIDKVEIYDLTGQKLVSRKTSNNEDINIQHLVSGSYFVRIYSDKGVKTHKLLKVN